MGPGPCEDRGAVDLGRLVQRGPANRRGQGGGARDRAWLENWHRGMAEVGDTDADSGKVLSKVQSGTETTIGALQRGQLGGGAGRATSADASPAWPRQTVDTLGSTRTVVSVPADATVGGADQHEHRTCPHTSGRFKSINILLGGKSNDHSGNDCQTAGDCGRCARAGA